MSKSMDEKELLDLAARIAVQAKIDRVERSQIENLLSSVEIASDPGNSPWIVALYAYRQAGRDRIKRGTANLIYEAMSRLSETGAKREDVRRFLGFVKWIYESLEGKEISRTDVKVLTFKDVLKMLKSDQHARL